jgi:hypothetical protein
LTDLSHNLMRLSLHFDPYSSAVKGDYEALRGELQKIDIFALLKAELVKSRIHISLSKKIVSAIRFIEEPQRSGPAPPGRERANREVVVSHHA